MIIKPCQWAFFFFTMKILLSFIVPALYLRQKSKADFTVGNILSFNQYFGRHGLPSSGSYIYRDVTI